MSKTLNRYFVNFAFFIIKPAKKSVIDCVKVVCDVAELVRALAVCVRVCVSRSVKEHSNIYTASSKQQQQQQQLRSILKSGPVMSNHLCNEQIWRPSELDPRWQPQWSLRFDT